MSYSADGELSPLCLFYELSFPPSESFHFFYAVIGFASSLSLADVHQNSTGSLCCSCGLLHLSGIL